MSDPGASSTKPKVGSLRDRIAAFEKPTTGNSPSAAPRPKPGGLSWKPKVPSPPSSPGGSEHAVSERKVGGMSASDAKESIGKAGSLKERMAALQGKGAFGAPPPVAPKPAAEKPKWKPPPVVAPGDQDEDERAPAESLVSSPSHPMRSSQDKLVMETHEEEAAPAAESEEQTQITDPEEEERERRASIAARMARLGGARVGMAPMFGPPPVAKKPERAQLSSLKDGEAKPVDPPAEMEQAVETSPINAPARRSSESLSQPSGDSEPQVSHSMPLPSAPRRAGPPRKKAVKSPTLPTAVAEVPVTESPDILSTSNTLTIANKADAGGVNDETAEEGIEPSGDLGARLSTERPVEASAEIPEKESSTSDVTLGEHGAGVAEGPFRKHEDNETSEVEETKSIGVAPPSHSLGVSDGDDAAYEPMAVVPVEQEDTSTKADDGVEKPFAQPSDELDEDEESARRKRIAEKLTKMGGVNPFTLPPPTQSRSSTDEMQTSPPASPPLAKRVSLSRQSTGPPQRKQSLRKSSVDSTTALEEATASAQRRMSVDETQSSPSLPPRLVQRASLSRQSIDFSPPQRKQSLRKSSVDSTLLEESTVQSSVEFPSQPSTISPLSRKTSVDTTVSGRVAGSGQSQDVADHIGQGIATRIPEENETIKVLGKHGAYTEEPESEVKGGFEVKISKKLDAAVEPLETVDSDEEPDAPIPLVIPTPPVPKWSTRPQEVSVDPALAVNPVPIPPRTLEQVPPAVVTPPTRSIPPPPLLVPQHDDEGAVGSDHKDEEASVSHQTFSQQISEEESLLPRHMPLRLAPDDDNTDNESVPLPIPTRRPPQPQGGRSPATSLTSSSRPNRRSLPPPPPPPSAPASDFEQDSDLDEILPTPPRHRPTTPGTPPSNEVPLIVPPPHADDPPRKIAEPSPLRHSYAPPMRTSSDSRSSTPDDQSPSHLTPTVPVSEQEILDEEEGDPIDPEFHSPSRPGSTVNLLATAAPQHTQVAEPAAAGQPGQLEDAEQVKRTTIAERMAKLGGIKFGAAPVPPSINRPPPLRPDDESGAPSSDAPGAEEQAETDEEEERARKERIAAKLAGMGGMRIGMMPLGPGALRPQQSHALRGDNATPLPAAAHSMSRAVPPSRPPPPAQSDSEPEHEGMSASQHSLSTSEEGVKVEAEESEIEEVSHEDAKEEDTAPPVPTRPARRSTSETESIKAATIRPPVPISTPTRRSSIQTVASGRKSSIDSSFSPRRSSTVRSQSDYVMVEEPKGFTSGDVPSPPPPARPVSRAPPAREAPPRPPVPTADPADISSQWELPSIPSSSFEFGGNTDLSLSWSDASAVESSVTTLPPPAPSTRASQIVSADRPRSSDDLIAIWGRVGVQICEVATSLFEKSKKSLVGDGTYRGFVDAVVSEVPNTVLPAPPSYGYVVYMQSGSLVQKRVSEIMPGDIVELQDAKFKGHKGIQTYNQHVGVDQPLVGVVSEFEPKKSKIRLFQANQHVGQQTVEAVSYRLEDLKSGVVKAYRVLDA